MRPDGRTVAEFREHGFIVVPEAWSSDTVEAIRQAADTAFAQEPWLDPHHVHPPGTDLYAVAADRELRSAGILGHFRPHLLNHRVCAMLGQLMHDEPVVLSDIEPFRTSPSIRTPRPGEPGRDPRRNAHVHHFNHFEPASGPVMGWFALEDIAANAGPMWIVPGSHKRNPALFDDVMAMEPSLRERLDELRRSGATHLEWMRWGAGMQQVMTDLLEARIDDGAGERFPVLLGAGDLLLFDSALTHGTMVPADPEATRWSLLARYQGRHTREYGWPTWLESEPYAPALPLRPARRVHADAMRGGLDADRRRRRLSRHVLVRSARRAGNRVVEDEVDGYLRLTHRVWERRAAWGR